MNLNYKLYSLFREYLKRKEKERKSYYTYPGYCGGYRPNSSWLNQDEKYDGVVYFYEWSDTNRQPITFFNLNAFDAFLRRSDIFMSPFHKDMIRQLDRSYITCRKGTHNIVIRGTKAMLEEAINKANSPDVDSATINSVVPQVSLVNPDSNLPLPYTQGRMPPMYSGCECDAWYG